MLKIHFLIWCVLLLGWAESTSPVCDKPQCPVNETYVECKVNCPTNYCRLSNGPVPLCSPPHPCPPGCVCLPNYLRNTRKEGRCILKSDCPPMKCGENQQYNKCGSPNPPTCDDPEPENCDDDECVAGCFCIPGYVKNKNGDCVPLDKCPKKCSKDNEEYQECGTACPVSCNTYKNTCLFCTMQCVQGCFCKKGYIRNKNGDCIEPKDCPPRVCGKNEKFDWCPPHCPTENCSAIWSRVDCSKADTCCDPKCRCIPGYYRNKDKKCVSSKECQSNCPPHSKFNDCGSACPLTCEKPKPGACTKNCVPRCVCDEGYLETKDGKCVKPDQCPKPPCEKCGEHEEYKECGTACPKTCKNKDIGISCSNAKCVSGCFCKEGYVKDDKGKCIKPEQCPKPPCEKCGEHEEYKECGTACPKTCKNKDKDISCVAKCVSGCFCKEGYVKDDKGKCIKPEQCPPQCPDHSKFNKCGSACPLTCEKPKPRPCTKNCVPRCVCDEGYLETKDGKCVKPDKCPKPPSDTCDGENEEFQQCGTACPKTCKNKDIKINCIEKCVKGCFCKKGYVRDDKGKCIEPKKCPPQCPANSKYNKCGSACPLTCEKPKPTVCTRQCVPRCVCDEGYLETKDGKCVKPDKCPKPPCDKCGEHEEFKECGTACPKTCKNLGAMIKCTDKCVVGCFCKEGYVKDDKGKCIKPEKCPKKDCPRNEHWEPCLSDCPGDSCLKNQEGYKCPVYIRAPPCNPRCVCDKGRRRDDKGKCIPSDECPKPDEECDD